MHRAIRLIPIHCVVMFAIASLLVPAAGAHAQTDSLSLVQPEFVLQSDTVAQGSDVVLAVVLDLPEGWHVYANDGNIPDAYFPTEVVVEPADPAAVKVHAGYTQWPHSHTVEFAGDTVDFLMGRVVIYVPLSVSPDAPLGITTLKVKPAFQTCDDFTCLFPTPHPKTNDAAWKEYGFPVELEIVAPGSAPTTTEISDVFSDFDASVYSKIHAGVRAPEVVKFDLFGLIAFDLDVATGTGIVLLVLLALLGGFMLNLTPCVLPVIPLKIMSLANSAGNRGRTLLLGFMMYLGILAFWMALGVGIAAISAFTSTNQLFQEPWFNIALGAFIALMAVGMCGVFAIRLPQAVYKVSPKHDSLAGSFGFGVMTGILATPCTAPFMGAAAAWAATQTPLIVLIVFAAIANGMALPYLFLSAFPNLVKKMPRSGPASELIKQVMGLLMLAAAAFFIGVGVSGMLQQDGEGPSRLYIWVVCLLVAMAGGWLLWRTLQIAQRPLPKAVFGTLGVITVAASVALAVRLTDPGPIDWVYYTPQRFATAKSEGNIVVMEFTAEWCLNCKALEESVLRTDRVADLLAADDVVPIKVDLTGNNTDGNAMLKEVDRLTIPLLVVFDPQGAEVFKGDFYTVQQVLDAVAEARSRRGAVAATVN